jgi:hypothetical protein
MEKHPAHPDLLLTLSQRAAACRKKAAEIRKSARARSSHVLDSAEEQARALELAARVFEAEASGEDVISLQSNSQHAKVRAMHTAHRVHLSAAHTSPDDRLTPAANKANPPHSVNSLAKAVEVSATLLRQAHKGKLTIKESVCMRVRDELGKDANGAWLFDATAANWPRMRAGK